MFGLFRTNKRSPLPPEDDRVYLSDGPRLDAVAAGCRQALGEGRAVALVSPWRGHLSGLRQALAARGLEVDTWDDAYRSSGAGGDAVPLLEAARFVQLAARVAPGRALTVMQIERHPLRAHDDAVAGALGALAPAGHLLVHVSLDDGLMQVFGERLRSLMEKLDMGASEVITHALVTRSIAAAQEKLAQRVKREVPADSFADWRERNLGPA